MGGITEIATSAPGYNSIRPPSKAPLAKIIKHNGYATAQLGKCHEVPVWQTSPLGPFDAWPSGGGGFEHFYGFIGGETNQDAPGIYQDTVAVEPDRTPEGGCRFTEDMTDRAIAWIRQQKALMGEKTFFVYYAPGATHAPTTFRCSARTSTGASSTTAGTSCASGPSPGRRNSASSRRRRS
jgi:arylsulfatase